MFPDLVKIVLKLMIINQQPNPETKGLLP